MASRNLEGLSGNTVSDKFAAGAIEAPRARTRLDGASGKFVRHGVTRETLEISGSHYAKSLIKLRSAASCGSPEVNANPLSFFASQALRGPRRCLVMKVSQLSGLSLFSGMCAAWDCRYSTCRSRM